MKGFISIVWMLQFDGKVVQMSSFDRYALIALYPPSLHRGASRTSAEWLQNSSLRPERSLAFLRVSELAYRARVLTSGGLEAGKHVLLCRSGSALISLWLKLWVCLSPECADTTIHQEARGNRRPRILISTVPGSHK